jgi:hypothetical protein
MNYNRIPYDFFIIMIAIMFLSACAQAQPAMPTAMTANHSGNSLTPGTSAYPIATSPGIPRNSPQPVGETPQGTAQEQALAPETNPIGDIPDNQVFVTYSATPGNYSFDVPEGWARTIDGSNVRFIEKFDGISVTLAPSSAAPAAAATDPLVQAQIESQRAFKSGEITKVKLPAGEAVQITGSANSDPDPVTGKQVRLEEEIFLFYQKGTLAAVRLWAPQGADNVDQWKRMIESFRWN